MRDTVKDLQEWKYTLLALQPIEVKDSSQIKALAYLEERQMLVVHFTYNKAIYAYANIIPDFWQQLVNAPSKGQFLSQRIKIHPDLFPFLRLQ